MDTPLQQPVPPAAPVPSQGTQPQKPGAPLPQDMTKSNKRFVLGCLTAFGCSIFLFIGALFAFLMSGAQPDNPIFKFLGVPPEEVVNFLITLVSLIFLILIVIAFIFTAIGVFKMATAKKDDREGKRKGAIYTFLSLAALIILIMLWIIAYFFLADKRTTAPSAIIKTEPAETINLTAPVDVTFAVNESALDTRRNDILSYEWNFGDGSPAARGAQQTHTYNRVGNFDAVLAITVREKATREEASVKFSTKVTVSNALANVVIKTDVKKGEVPLTVKFDGSASNTINGQITGFAWDLNGDSLFDDGEKATAEKTFDKVGIHKVSLRVTDSTGQYSINTVEIEAAAKDQPTAVIEVEGVSGDELATSVAHVFNGASSRAAAGNIEKYHWEFGDGDKAETRTATHVFATPGVYEVMLTVTDGGRKTAQSSRRFTVKAPSLAPVAAIKTTPEAVDGVVSGTAPLEVAFNAIDSTDPNGDIVEYAWDFDGDSKTDDVNPVATHRFAASGTRRISLTVTDAGNLSSKAFVVVQVASTGLQADIRAEPASGTVPLIVRFDASGSSYADGKIVSYEWDFGDGGKPRLDTAKVTYQYTSVGTFTAKVTAIGADNKRATAEIPIHVRSVPLKACFEPSTSSGKAPLEVEFDPTCSEGTVIKYRWQFGETGKSFERKPNYTFQTPGEYEVILDVADSDNLIDRFTQKITVAQ